MQNGITVVAGNEYRNGINQLYNSYTIFIDDAQNIYVTDSNSHRIIQWKKNTMIDQLVAGENGVGNRNDQFDSLVNAIVDKKNDCLMICDYDNKRVV